MEPFLAQIIGFAGNFAPRGWALCDGQLLPINSYQALFSLLGTTYGGDGRTTFGLPDLRGRSIVHPGNGPGLPTVQLDEKGGAAQFTMQTSQMPSHNHIATLHGETALADASNPNGKLLAGAQIYAVPVPADNKTMAPESVLIQNNGGGQPVQIRSPFQGVNYIIALTGVFPSRN